MGARVLIVEDELIVAEDLQNKLQQLGHEVVGSAATGEDAVKQAASLTPNLILMDVRLQGSMTGIEAAQHIQAMADIPIVYVTAYSAAFLRQPEQSVSPGLWVRKPFSMGDLKAIVDVALRSKESPVNLSDLA